MRQNKRFMLTALLALVAIMALCFTLAACNAKEYSVNLQFEESQGNVELSPAAESGKYKEGTELTVTVTPRTGYVLDEFKLSTDSNAALDSNGKFVFTVSQDTTINVTFKPEPKQKYTLTVPTVENGEIKVSPTSPDNKYDEGTQITITLEPAAQYEVATFTVGGVDHKADLQENKYSFAISGDTAIAATFSKIINKYTLTVPTVENGEIKVSPASPDNKYDEGTQITITLEPAAQYEVATFKVGGVDHKADLQDNKYSFAISGDTAIAATFSKIINRYTLTVPTVENGEIKVSPTSPDNKYDEGTQITITLEPAVGYEVSEFTVDSVDKKSELQDNVYSFSIEKETSINASFSKKQYNVTTEVKGVSEKGSISLAPQKTTYEYGDQVTVTVIVQAGHGVTPSTFKVSTDEEAVLNEEKTYTLTVSADTEIEVTIHEHECSDWSVVTLDPTYHEGYCNICDEHYREFHYSMIQHTSDTEENEIYTCPKNCGYERKVTHDFEGEWTDDDDGNCHKQCQNESCNYVITKEHDINWEVLPTASEGHVGSCTRCSYTVTEEHDELGEGGVCSKCHYKKSDVHVCADNAVNGFYDGLCDICNKIVNDVWTFVDGKITVYNGTYENVLVPSQIGETLVPVTELNQNLFKGKETLKKAIISKGITTMGNATFSGCKALTSVIFLAEITNIPANTFTGCVKLTDLVLPATLTEFHKNAFGTSTTYKAELKVKNVYFMGTSESWDSVTRTDKVVDALSEARIMFLTQESQQDGWHWEVENVIPKPWVNN